MWDARQLPLGLALFLLGCGSSDAAMAFDAAADDQNAPGSDAGASDAAPGVDGSPGADGSTADAATSDACTATCQPCPGGPVYCSPNCPTYGCPVLDASADAGYGACFASDGSLTALVKGCQSDLDCSFAYHQTSCCGTRQWVGIAIAQAEVTACERAWDSHFPACGCAEGPTTTEDGKTSDGAAPHVRCILEAGASGLCETWQ